MMRAFVMLALLLAPTGVRAENEYAVAVNAPTSWIGRGAFGATGYRALTKHHGLRANIATYRYIRTDEAIESALDGVAPQTEFDGSGRVYDAAFGWQGFTRRPYDGFSFDVDLLVRRTSTERDIMDGAIERRAETFVGVRVMGSWFWRIEQRFFVSASLGAAKGNAWIARETVREGQSARSKTDERVEGFVRFGVLLGRD